MITAIGIVCKDLQESISFYKLLGLDFEQQGGPDHYESVREGTVKIMLDSESLAKKLYPNWNKKQNQNVSLCFEKNSPAEVNELYEKLIQQGGKVIKKPWDAFWGQRYATLFDLDGNQIDLYANL